MLERRVKELRIGARTPTSAPTRSAWRTASASSTPWSSASRISLLDVARDVGFLQMDLEYRDRPDLAEAFVRRYLEVADDPDLGEVLPFYAYYSACVRGKVEAFLLDIPSVSAREKKAAAERARRYFELACRYAQTLPPALLVITCGMSGSGKSTVAREIKAAVGGEVIASDVVRKRLAGMDPAKRALDEYREGLYSAEMSRKTYGKMFAEARELLMRGKSVVIDAAFLRRADRRKAAVRLARETGAQFACILTTADDRETRRRLEARLATSDPSDGRWEIYAGQKRHFQRPGEVPANRLFKIDTVRAMKPGVRKAIAGLKALSPLSVR